LRSEKVDPKFSKKCSFSNGQRHIHYQYIAMLGTCKHWLWLTLAIYRFVFLYVLDKFFDRNNFFLLSHFNADLSLYRAIFSLQNQM
jgi:hypothetical protein